MSHVQPLDGTGGQSNGSLFERLGKHSWQRRCDDDRGLSAGQCRPYPSSQCTCVCLCSGRLDRDAGERRQRSDFDHLVRRSMKAPMMFTSFGRNASKIKPAKFVLVMVKDKGAPVL